ncbi:MAG: RHS repeat protein [Oligoflexia bacterium]|nr:RHS repeat protein [Oligoflexia bacterium]
MQKTLPDNTYNYAYDIRGNLVGVNNLNSQITFGVDVADRVTSVNSQGLGAGASLPQSTLQFNYDANNNRLSMTDNSGAAVLYNYDELNRLTSLRNHKAEVFSFNYDDMSRLISLSRPGSNSQFSFDNSNFISSINHVGTGTIASFNYSRDGLGNVLSINTSYGLHSYGYDANSQLTSARHPASTGINDENYTYDSVGNRLSDNNGNYTYDASSQRLNEDYRYLYIYDNNGNLIRKYPRNSTDLAYEYQYTSENQLKTVNIYNGMLSVAQYGPQIKNINYTYDALGRRVQKKRSTILLIAQNLLPTTLSMTAKRLL